MADCATARRRQAGSRPVAVSMRDRRPVALPGRWARLGPMPTDKRGRTSAGLLLYRRPTGRLEVLLAHPGGPFHERKDADAWTVPKGEAEPGEALLDVARREFAEETGHDPPAGVPIDLGEIFQKSGKRVLAWALEGDLDPAAGDEQHVRAGVAAPIRPARDLPGDRSRRLVRPARGSRQAQGGAGAVPRPARPGAGRDRGRPCRPLAERLSPASRARLPDSAHVGGRTGRTARGPTTGARTAGSQGRSRSRRAASGAPRPPRSAASPTGEGRPQAG